MKRRLYTPEEDDLIPRYCTGEVELDELVSTGRTLGAVREGTRREGAKWPPHKATWEWPKSASAHIAMTRLDEQIGSSPQGTENREQ